MKKQETYTAAQIALRCGLHKNTVLYDRSRGRLGGIMLDDATGTYLFKRADVAAYMFEYRGLDLDAIESEGVVSNE